MTENETLATTQTADLYPDPRFKDMVEAGVFYGRKRSKTHPRMKPSILTTRNEIEIINLAKTVEALERATAFLKEKLRGTAFALLVGTQPPAVEGILKAASEFTFPSVTTRWLGGTLTNYRVISKRIEYFKKLRADFASGVLEQKYTKKERLGFERELERFALLMGGLENLNGLPGVLIVIDPAIHTTAVREARRLHIPIIALTNTDSDPDDIDYPVPGNTKARTSINWFLSKIEEAIREAKREPIGAPEGGTEEAPAPILKIQE